MKILLTGASGMVGHNLMAHPLARKHEWLTPTHSELDLLDFSSVFSYVEKNKPDLVIHAAGKVGGIQANMREPVHFLIDNLDMGRNVLIASLQGGVKQLINIGSSCMYPRNRDAALVEEDVLTGELEPTNEGYSLAKISIATLADYISREHQDCIYKTVIPCNLYGTFDKFDPKWSHLIPAVIHKLHMAKINGDTSVEIWGSGEARREFLFVEDLVTALLLASDDLASMPQLMNIGLGFDYSVNDYYQIAAEVIGYKGSFVHDLTKPVGMSRKLTSVNKAKQWGWVAETSLHDGLQKTYNFYLKTIQGN